VEFDMVVEAQPIAGARAGTDESAVTKQKVKPRWRGIPDVIALFGFVPAAIVLVTQAAPGVSTIAALVYASSLVALFAVSAAYHTPRWPMHVRMFWRRLDHSTIYVLIAGCYTPVCLLILPETQGSLLLAVVWGLTVLGFLKSFFWPTSPRALNTMVYVAMGWLVVPELAHLRAGFGDDLILLAIGGALYTIGAVVYVRRWPNPLPHIFGYHEVFHLFVVAAAACQYAAFWTLLTTPR
jgi:hemolysin III